jgi:glutamyl-tRNA synthetase
VFNTDKLLWLNAHYIKNGDPARLAGLLAPHLVKRGIDPQGGPEVAAVVRTLQVRAQTLEEMAERAVFYFKAPDTYDEVALAKFDKEHLRAVYDAVADRLATAAVATVAEIDALLKEICTDKGWKMGQVGQPLRIALSGGSQAPGIDEIVVTLGIDEAVRRITRARETVAA